MSTLNLVVVKRHPYCDAQNAVYSSWHAHVSMTELRLYRYILILIKRIVRGCAHESVIF
jgi:hypothetical protein